MLTAALIALISVQRQANALANDKRALLRGTPSVISTGTFVATAFDLPQLQSAAVVKSFNAIAADLHVPLEEVAYSLENPDRTPYVKYRITVTTKVGYGEIRKFLAVLSSEMPNAALDSIRCSRADATLATLGCELVFSAFFSKSGHG